MKTVVAACLLGVVLCAQPAWAQLLVIEQLPAQFQGRNLKKLTIEELSQLDVTVAARRSEPLSEAAAAVTILRQEDLRRMGITTLPDALRLVTGMHAAQVFGAGWAISARGFNISTANKLLVMIDGRTVYSPVFSGVFWESQDLFLADVERIEVIRGPGGALWGANAVNGVINVITRRASDTRGLFVRTGVGTENRAYAGLRYGGTLGSATFRIYGQFRAEDDRDLVAGGSALDAMQFAQTGFRVDSRRDQPTHWTIQGDVFAARSGYQASREIRHAGGNVLGRVTRDFSPSARFQLQAYYDRTFRRVPVQYRGLRDTFDIDTQHEFRVGDRHGFVVGAGARVSRGDDLGDGPGFFFQPRLRTSWLVSGFIQDEMALVPARLFVTLGAKFERSDFTDVEILPTSRIRWVLTDKHSVWGAVSRAVRMPTRFDTDLRIVFPPTGQVLLTGSEDFKSENVLAYEAGYRGMPVRRLTIDVAAFANRYTDLRSQELPAGPGSPVVLANTLTARTSGLEVSVGAQLAAAWQVQGSYTYLWQRFGRDPDSRDVTNGASEANDPRHLWRVRSYIDVGESAEIDAFVRFSGALPQPALPGYTELNLRFGWRFGSDVELSVIGQNLIRARHEEFIAGTPREYVSRGVHVRLDWRF